MQRLYKHPLHLLAIVVALLAFCHTVTATKCTECPSGTMFVDNACKICPTGQYCPGGCASTKYCPLGTFNNKEYQSEESSCKPCPKGSYTVKAGSNSCLSCPSGFYCPSNSEVPVICPVGHFCDVNSASARPCPVNSYSSEEGQSHCTSCGSTSTSMVGSKACQCIGANRVHMSDGACRCKGGFVKYTYGKTDMIDVSTKDDRSDCEQQATVICPQDYVRDINNACVYPEDPYACDKECEHVNVELSNEQDLTETAMAMMRAKLRGHFDTKLRTCVCAAPSNAELCPNGDCGNVHNIVANVENGKLYLTVSNPLTTEFHTASLLDMPNVFAPAFRCTGAEDCTVVASTVTNDTLLSHVGVSKTLARYAKMAAVRAVDSVERIVEIPVSSTDIAQPVVMAGVKPLNAETKLESVQARVLLQSPDNTLRDSVVCLPHGGSMLFHLEGGYPMFANNHAYTSGAMDYSAFLRLQQRIQSGVRTDTFLHTFTEKGTFAFTNSDGKSLLVVSVMDKNVKCPAEFKTAATLHSGSSTHLNIMAMLDQTPDPDLDIVYILIGIFVGVSLLLTLFSKLTQYQARRARALYELPDDTIARQNFRKLQQDLQQQQSEHKMLFQNEIDTFRGECDRIAAETEQLKALLSVKITDSAGFLRAARNLIMAESTAREAFDHTQGQLERKIIHHIIDLTTAIKEQLSTEPNTEGPQFTRANEKMCIVGAELAGLISELGRSSKRERARRELLVKNSGIIGEELINVMNQKEDAIVAIEGKLATRLIDFRESILEPKINEIIAVDTNFATRTGELRKQRNKNIVRSIVLGFKVQVDTSARTILNALVGDDDSEVSPASLEPIVRELTTVRTAALNDTDQALLSVRKMITAATTKQKLAVFVGVPPELERALRLFLCQAGAAILGDNVLMNDIGLAVEDKKSSANDANYVDGLQALVLETLSEQPYESINLTGDIDQDFELLLNKAGESNLNPEDLKQLYNAYLKKQDMMDKIISDQKEQSLQQAQEMLAMEISNNEDRAALDKATDLLRALIEKHEQEKQELTARLNAEQERDMEREISEQAARAAAENAKYEEERRRLEKELEEKRRNMVSGSDEEHAAIAEHVLKLKRLDENKRDEQGKYQQGLKDKHAQWKLKRQRELDALKGKQKSELRDREKEYQDTITQIKSNDHGDNFVAGVDIAALAARIDGFGNDPTSPKYNDQYDEEDEGLVDDEETRAERRKLLEERALQKKMDMQREHDEMKRKLDADIERERAEQLRILEDDAERRRLEALQRLHDQHANILEDEEGEPIDQAKLDSEEGRRLLEKYEREKRDLEKQLNAENDAQRNKLDAALKARAAQKQKQLQNKHDKDKEDADKERQQLEKNLVQREKKQKEEELLQHVINEKQIDESDGASIIENVMAERQKKELAELMKQQRAEAAIKAKEMLDSAYVNLFAKKDDIKAAREEGQISAEEEQRQLAQVENDVDIDKLKAQIEREIKDKHERELTEAKEQFNDEIKGMFAKIYGDDAAKNLDVHRWEDKKELERKLREAEDRKRAEEDEIRRKQLEVEAEIEAMKQDAERLRQEQLKEEMVRVEAQMVRDREEMDKRLAEQEAKAKVEKERALAEREKQLKEDQDAALDEAEREAILKRYNDELESKLVQDELEKKRQNIELQKRLKAREDQRKNLAAKRAQDKVRRKLEENEAWVKAEEEAERLREQNAALQEKTVTARKTILYKLVKAGKMNAACRKVGVNGTVAVLAHVHKEEMDNIQRTATELGEGNIVAGLNKMNIPASVKQAFLASLPASAKLYVGEGGDGVSHTAVAGVLDGLQDMISSVVGVYDGISDSVEQGLSNQHGPDAPIKADTLALREFMAVRFAQWVADICMDANNVPSVSIVAANKISEPQKFRERCMFRHSYNYDAATRVVLIHKNRLHEVGTLSSIMTTVCAHVAANSWIDTSKVFVECYQRASQTLMRELFWAKSHSVQSELKVQPPQNDARVVGCRLSAKDPLQGQFEFVSGTNWHNAEAQWNAVRSSYDRVKQLKQDVGVTNDLRVNVCEDVIGDFVDVRMKGNVSGWTALYKRLEAYKAFRETEQLRKEVVRIEENIRYNVQGQDIAIEANKGDIRVEDVDEDDEGNDDAKLTGGDSVLLLARRERLKNEADALHIDLIDLVTKSLESTRRYADFEQKLAKANDTSANAQPLSAEEMLSYGATRDVIRRLAVARATLMSRIDELEDKCKRIDILLRTENKSQPETAEEKA